MVKSILWESREYQRYFEKCATRSKQSCHDVFLCSWRSILTEKFWWTGFRFEQIAQFDRYLAYWKLKARVWAFIRSLQFQDNGDVEKAHFVYSSEDGERTLTAECHKSYSNYQLCTGQTAKYLANSIDFVNHGHHIREMDWKFREFRLICLYITSYTAVHDLTDFRTWWQKWENHVSNGRGTYGKVNVIRIPHMNQTVASWGSVR